MNSTKLSSRARGTHLWVASAHHRLTLRPVPVNSRPRVAVRSTEEETRSDFFSDAFREALAAALDRTPELSMDEGMVCPTNLARPKRVDALEPSASETMIGAALEASQTSLNRMLALQSEVNRAVERERAQVERLAAALEQAKKNEDYYRILRQIQDGERGATDIEE